MGVLLQASTYISISEYCGYNFNADIEALCAVLKNRTGSIQRKPRLNKLT